ncbi:MAG TPA: hypothetical protein VGD44_01735, partial [Phenylobacterium sp.]
MTDAAPMLSRDEAMLARLAELDLAAAEKAHAKLMAAEEASEIAELGRTYQRMARSLRQTLALKAKLAREREAAAPKAAPKARPEWPDELLQPLTPKARGHVERVHAAVMPFIEREKSDWWELDEAAAYEILIELAHDPAFADTPVDDLVAAVLDAMDLPAPDAPPSEPTSPAPPVQ